MSQRNDQLFNRSIDREKRSTFGDGEFRCWNRIGIIIGSLPPFPSLLDQGQPSGPKGFEFSVRVRVRVRIPVTLGGPWRCVVVVCLRLLVYMFKPVTPPARISCAECNANQPMLPASTYTAISNATTDRLITWFS